MSQQIINVGEAPNDGTGEPLRSAFTAVNNNFDQVWAAGPVGSQIAISNNVISTTQTNLDLVLHANGIGNITVYNSITPWTDSVYDLGSANNQFDTVWARYYRGNASQMTGLPVVPNLSAITTDLLPSASLAYDIGSSSLRWDNIYARNGSFTGNMSIGGNLLVSGNVTYIDSTVVDIKDKNITLAYGSPNALAADGAGITIAGANAQIYYDNDSNTWTFNLPITTPNIVFPDGSVLDTANTVHIGETPSDKGDGNLWFNSDDGRGYVKYNDQWIEFCPPVIPNPATYLGNLTIDGEDNSTLYFPPGGAIEFGDGSVQTTAFTGTANIDFTNVASNIIPSANVTYSLGNSTNWWANAWFGANTIYIGGVPVGVTGNTLTVDGNSVVTANTDGTLNANDISVTGNIEAAYFIGNGSQLTGLPAVYSNANVATFMANFGSNSISTTGNITGGNLFGNGYNLLNVNAAQVVNGTSNVKIPTANGNLVATVGGAQQWIYATDGSTIFPNGAKLNAGTANQFATDNNVVESLDLRDTAGRGFYTNSDGYTLRSNGSKNWIFGTSGDLSAPGNIITSGNIGNPGVPSSINNINMNGNIVFTPYLGSIVWSGGASHIDFSQYGHVDIRGSDLSVFGNAIASGNVSADYFFGDGGLLSNLQISGSNPVSTTGNVAGGNLIATGTVSASGNVTSGNVLTDGVVSAAGNVRGANINTAGIVSAAGNIYGDYLFGNASQLTGLPATYGNANVVANLAALGSNPVSTTGNITGGNILTGGLVSATGNVTGNYILGNGSQLTGLPATYSNSNVTTLLADFGSNTISTTGNINAGNVTLNGNLTVNGSPIYGVPASYGKYTRTTAQTSGGFPANSVVICNVTEAAFGSDISSNSGTGQITLTAGRTYRLRGKVPAFTASSGGGRPTFCWYNETTAAYIGEAAMAYGASDSATFGAFGGTAEVIITPGVTTVVSFRLLGSNGTITGFGQNGDFSATGDYPWVDIQVIGGQAPITAFSTAGNVTGGNILTAGIISATGNVTGDYILGNAALMTGIPASYGNANVVANLAALGSNPVSTTGNISSGNLATAGNVTFTANSGNLTFNTGAYISGNANSISRDGSILLSPYTGAGSTFPGVIIGGAGRLLAPSGSVHQIFNASDVTTQVVSKIIVGTAATSTTSGALQVTGGIGATGNIFAGGTANTGVSALVAGTTNTLLVNTVGGFTGNVNSYTQVTFQNKNTGADATADFILTADNGSDTVNYGDFGIINSGYDNATPTNSLGNIVFAADTYLYAQGNTGNASQSGGNLAIGTTVPGKNVKIFAGGVTNSNIVANISNTGVAVTGTVSASGNITTAGNFVGNGAALTNVTVSVAGNIVGTQANVTLVAGSYSTVFDNGGNVTAPSTGYLQGGTLKSTNSTGNEGGELQLALAPNATISGSTVSFDSYINRVRIFEGGGNARGVYIDLAKAPDGVGGELMWKASGLVNAGVDVTLGNLRARIPTSGNRSLQISTVSGTYSVSGSNLWYAGSTPGGAYIDGSTPLSVTTTPAYLRASNNFSAAGYMDTWVIYDASNSIGWRITCIIGMSYNNNMISIERLL